MLTKRLAAPVLCLLLICASSCTDDIKWQNKFKGIWVLQSRVLPDGKEITPPAISGRMEWFPMDAEHAVRQQDVALKFSRESEVTAFEVCNRQVTRDTARGSTN